MLHKQHYQVEHWGLKCLVWLQEPNTLLRLHKVDLGHRALWLPWINHPRKHTGNPERESFGLLGPPS